MLFLRTRFHGHRGTNLVQGKDSDMAKLGLARPRQGLFLQNEKP